MSGRGRGRGRGGGLSFNKAFGYTKPEDVLPPTGQPPPLYPPLEFKPVPLLTGKKITYLLTLKQEIRSSFKESGYFIPPVSAKKDIERYTDKYRQIQASDQIVWDKTLFPKELFEGPPRKKRKIKEKSLSEKEALVDKLKVLEAKEETEEKENEEEEGENEEEYDEEELEEETDYAANYFDNGESYLDEDDDNDEGYEY